MSSIDNLSNNASASEMEGAIKVFESEQAELDKVHTLENPVKEAAEEADTKEVEATEEGSIEKVETIPEEAVEDETPITEATEKGESQDRFGGDYKKVLKSYDEGRKWNTRMSQEIAELKRDVESNKQAPQATVKQPENSMSYEQLIEWRDRDPISYDRFIAGHEADTRDKKLKEEIMSLKSGMASFYAKNTLNDFRTKYPDFKENENEIKESLSTLPREVVDNPAYYDTTLETAYWSVKGKKLKASEELAHERGVRTAQKKAKAKKEAYVEGSAKTSAEQPLNMDKMKSSEIMDFMKSKGIVQE